MYDSILDSVYETELRVMLILDATKKPITIENLAVLDTLTVNSKTLKRGNRDLNGKHQFASAELKTREALINNAIKILAVKELVHMYIGKDAITCSLTEWGEKVAHELNSAYAQSFIFSLNHVLKSIKDIPLREVIMEIMQSYEA